MTGEQVYIVHHENPYSLPGLEPGTSDFDSLGLRPLDQPANQYDPHWNLPCNLLYILTIYFILYIYTHMTECF
jgi:hypothetical protein